MQRVLNTPVRPLVRPFTPWGCRCLATVAAGWLATGSIAAADLANWAKGTTPGNYNEPANWSPAVVPVNGGGKTYVVEIPVNAQVSYDVTGAAAVEALRLNNGATFTIADGRQFTINGVSIISGPVSATGTGTAFLSTAPNASFGGYAALTAQSGARIAVAAPSFELPADWRASRDLFIADGANSRLEVGSLTSLTVHGGHSGAWDYKVEARNDGVIDLGGLALATGPTPDDFSNNDWLSFRINSGGSMDLDSLLRVSRRTRFQLEESLNLPALETVDMGYFYPAAGVTLSMPSLLRMEAGLLEVPNTATITAPLATAIRGTTIDVAPGGTLNAPSVMDLSRSTLVLEDGENLTLGTVTAVDSLSVKVNAGASLTLSPASYAMPEYPNDWRASRLLLEADGAGAELDVSTLTVMTIPGGHWGAWDYSVAAKNGGQLDLSGLTTVTGPRTDDYSNDDWLTFYLNSGGQLDLGGLRETARRVRFQVDQSLSLPKLETVQGSQFNVASGATLNAPLLQTVNDASFNIDFAGIVNAATLTTLRNGNVSLAAGGEFNAPNVNDIQRMNLILGSGKTINLGAVAQLDAASIRMIGPAPFTVVGTSYELPSDWRASRTLFEADGAGTSLDLGTLQTLTTHGGHSGGWDYTVVARNNGVVDLSGLQTAIGPRTDDFSNDDWLSFYVNTGGQMNLNALEQISRRVRFNLEESLSLPSLAVVEMGYFYPVGGVTLNLPALQRMEAGGLNIPATAEILMPVNTALRNTTIAIEPGGRLAAPAVTDLSGSTLQVSAGEDVTFGAVDSVDRMSWEVLAGVSMETVATSYSLPDYPNDWRAGRLLFEADGAGAQLDLGQMQTITAPGGHWGAWDYTVYARNGGAIELGSLASAVGCRTDDLGNDDWLTLGVDLIGTMTLGDVTFSRRARLVSGGFNSEIQAGSLAFLSPASLALNDRAPLRITGSLTFNNTTESQIQMNGGVLVFEGTGEQWLEVGGQDAGPGGFTSGNFGIGRLEVGKPGAPAPLKLVDLVDNGNRGAGGEPEALYIYGVDDVSLVVHPGSKVVLGDLNVYFRQAGTMVHLNSLLAGADAMTFGGGTIGLVAGPAIVSMTPSEQVLPVVDHVDVTFNTPVNSASFTAADVQITGPAGAISVSGITPLSPTEYRIAFPGQSAHGEITVRIGPNITDATGLLTVMDQDGNGAPGQPTDVFVDSFLVDVRGPAVTAAVALRDTGLVGVAFDEEVEATSLAAAGNYAISGVLPNTVISRTGNRSAALYFPALTSDTFVLDTVNLEDRLGNVLSTPGHFSGTVLPLSSVKVGGPTGKHEAFTLNGTRFELTAQGSALGGGTDSVQFFCEPREGDFDVKVKVEALSGAAHWARIGLAAREHAGSNSRQLTAVVHQPNQRNRYAFYRRSTQGSGYDNWGNEVSGVPLPNAWLRLQRVGNTFYAFSSLDGTDWVARAEAVFEVPDTVLVGFFLSSEDWDLNRTATGLLTDWGDYSPSFVQHPQSQTVFRNQTARLVAEARGVGTLAYQWYFNGNPIPGATSPLLERSNIQPAQAGDYHVVAQNAIGSVTSRTAVVGVDTSNPGAGFEADLMPRNAGDGTLGVADWTMVGRMAVGLEAPANASEFTRADCAPRTTLGNGIISIADWTQAGRYAAGLDPKTAAGGPNGIEPVLASAAADEPTARVLSLAGLPAGDTRLRVAARLRAMGNENALGFSVGFDASRLAYEAATPGADAAGAILMVNDLAAAEGRVGIVLALPAERRFRIGEVETVVLEFSQSETGLVGLSLTDHPVALEAVNPLAVSLPLQAEEESFIIRPAGAGLLGTPVIEGGRLTIDVQAEPGTTLRLEVSRDLGTWTDAAAAATVPVDGRTRFELVPPNASGPWFFRVRRVD